MSVIHYQGFTIYITKYKKVHVLTVTLNGLISIDACTSECTILVSESCKNLRTLLSTAFSDFRMSFVLFLFLLSSSPSIVLISPCLSPEKLQWK